MNCKECGHSEFNYNENLGEEYCIQCGFVRVVKIFEDRPIYLTRDEDGKVVGAKKAYGSARNKLGGTIAPHRMNSQSVRLIMTDQRFGTRDGKKALRTGLRECYMVLSYHSEGLEARRLVSFYYTKLYENKLMLGLSLTERACAIIFLVFRELEIPITANELGKKHSVKPATISKAARKYGRFLKKSHTLHSFNTVSWIDKTSSQLNINSEFYQDLRIVADYIDEVLTNNDISMTKSYLAVIIWITNVMRKKKEVPQYKISEVCSVTPQTLRNAYKRLFPIVNCKYEELDKLTIEEFVSGIRMD